MKPKKINNVVFKGPKSLRTGMPPRPVTPIMLGKSHQGDGLFLAPDCKCEIESGHACLMPCQEQAPCGAMVILGYVSLHQTNCSACKQAVMETGK